MKRTMSVSRLSGTISPFLRTKGTERILNPGVRIQNSAQSERRSQNIGNTFQWKRDGSRCARSPILCVPWRTWREKVVSWELDPARSEKPAVREHTPSSPKIRVYLRYSRLILWMRGRLGDASLPKLLCVLGFPVVHLNDTWVSRSF